MTVIADNKKRVTLPTKPGERFDLQVHGQDKFILTRLTPVETKETIRLVKKNGYTVAVGNRRISQAEVRKFLDEFP
jgi:predicted RNA binding protein YcfA (HicA-like mRNA interferase family)